jgi:hypothetical protein
MEKKAHRLSAEAAVVRCHGQNANFPALNLMHEMAGAPERRQSSVP